MNLNEESVREKQLIRCIPDVYNNKTLLYIGGHLRYGRNLQMTNGFIRSGCSIDVVEAFKDNISQLQTLDWIRFLWHNDIMEFLKQDQLTMKWDVVMFWHGVEHLEKSQVPELLKGLEKITRKLIIFATPNGVYEQNDEYGNPFEIHKSHWNARDFELLGMEVNTIGNPNEKNGNIIAWKRI